MEKPRLFLKGILNSFRLMPKSRQTFVIALVLLLIFALLSPLIFFKETNRQNEPNPALQKHPRVKSWRLTLAYDTKKGSLSLSNAQIINAVSFASPTKNSPYVLEVRKKDGKLLFQTGIHVTESILIDPYFENPSATAAAHSVVQAPSLETQVTIPYFQNGDLIIIKREGVKVLEAVPPKNRSFSFIPKALAQPASSTQNDVLHLVFIGDSYASSDKYKSDIEEIKKAFLETPPYDTSQNIFDFKVLDNPTASLGCVVGGNLNIMCLNSSSTIQAITDAVNRQYPDLPSNQLYTKIVILVNGSSAMMPGATNGAGGDISLITALNNPYFLQTAVHEVEGHAIGQLNDRYLYPDTPQMRQMVGPLRYKSNCSDSSSGEEFWKQNGSQGASPGCVFGDYFAPFPRTCPKPQMGSPDSIMSAAGCGGMSFDSVEKAWIKTQVLPQYASVGGQPASNTSPPQNTTTSPTGTSSSTNPSTSSGGKGGFCGAPAGSCQEGDYNCILTSCNGGNFTCARNVAPWVTKDIAAGKDPWLGKRYTVCTAQSSSTPSPASNNTTSPTSDITDPAKCGTIKPGDPGSLIPGSDKNQKDFPADKPWYYGTLKDSTDPKDPYFTAGQANQEGRWAGDAISPGGGGHCRGCLFSYGMKPSTTQRVGGFTYDPAKDSNKWDLSTRQNVENDWARIMRWTQDIVTIRYDKGNPSYDPNGIQIDRNCILHTQVLRLMNDAKQSGKNVSFLKADSNQSGVQYVCAPDPSCSNNKTSLQVCALKCTPK